MYRTLLRLPDGTELFSGDAQAAAIQSVSLTQSVNTGTELVPGAVCADMLEVTVLSAAGLSLEAGQEVTAYRVAPDGTRTLQGIYTVEAPQRPSPNTYRITAYDRVSRLDRDLTDFLASLNQWPYSLYELADKVCTACGLTLATRDIPNGSYPVQKFSAAGVTGRQLLQWVCQAACRFCRATPQGELELRWYAPNGCQLLPYQGMARLADYTVAPVQKVRICRTAQDIGELYPDDPAATNTLTVLGNPLLTEGLGPVAQTIYEHLHPLSYTPCTLTVPEDTTIRAGDTVTVGGRTVCVMQVHIDGHRLTLSATGSRRRDSTAAVNTTSYRALSGRVLELQADVEGLRIQHSDTAGNLAKLSLELSGIRSQVARQEAGSAGVQQQLTDLRQTADAVTVQVQRIQESGASRVTTGSGYTFDENGLHITRRDQEIENLLDNTGMYVRRAGQVILQAASDGVTAVDVKVGNYLHIGTHARLEDYPPGRTACFYVN